MSPIPAHDFGGSGPLLCFVHANAYPPGCYAQLIAPLLSHYRVIAPQLRPLWGALPAAGLRSWDLFVEDLLAFVEEQSEGGLVAVGHSLGAIVAMRAAQCAPDRFRALALVEPVLLPPAHVALVRMLPRALQGRVGLIRRALDRRDAWDSRQSAFDHFRPKAVFSGLSDAALWDVVNAGISLEEGNGRARLSFPKLWEAAIYACPPVRWARLLRRVAHPTLALRGEHSHTLGPRAWRRWQTLQPGATFVEIPEAGHLVPLERPAKVADVLLDFVKSI